MRRGLRRAATVAMLMIVSHWSFLHAQEAADREDVAENEDSIEILGQVLGDAPGDQQSDNRREGPESEGEQSSRGGELPPPIELDPRFQPRMEWVGQTPDGSLLEEGERATAPDGTLLYRGQVDSSVLPEEYRDQIELWNITYMSGGVPVTAYWFKNSGADADAEGRSLTMAVRGGNGDFGSLAEKSMSVPDGEGGSRTIEFQDEEGVSPVVRMYADIASQTDGDVLFANLRGTTGSGGTDDFVGPGTQGDVVNLAPLARSLDGVNPDEYVLVGFSRGGAEVLQAASRMPGVRGVAVVGSLLDLNESAANREEGMAQMLESRIRSGLDAETLAQYPDTEDEAWQSFVDEELRRRSPVAEVNIEELPDDAKYLIAQGSADWRSSPEVARDYYRSLMNMELDVEAFHVPGGNHPLSQRMLFDENNEVVRGEDGRPVIVDMSSDRNERLARFIQESLEAEEF